MIRINVSSRLFPVTVGWLAMVAQVCEDLTDQPKSQALAQAFGRASRRLGGRVGGGVGSSRLPERPLGGGGHFMRQQNLSEHAAWGRLPKAYSFVDCLSTEAQSLDLRTSGFLSSGDTSFYTFSLFTEGYHF